jgi:hypothetical protein
MFRVLPLLLLNASLLAACQSRHQERAAAAAEIRKSYAEVVALENAPPASEVDTESSPSPAQFREMHLQSMGVDFWKEYAFEREEIGREAALRMLESLIQEYGVASILIMPMQKAMRLPEEETMTDLYLTTRGVKTARLTRIAGDPPDLAQVRLYQSGARLVGDRLVPY